MEIAHTGLSLQATAILAFVMIIRGSSCHAPKQRPIQPSRKTSDEAPALSGSACHSAFQRYGEASKQCKTQKIANKFGA